ncbi:hypothetical protein BDW72DRAFT_183570 [Aspergillus terricola var. indicus]
MFGASSDKPRCYNRVSLQGPPGPRAHSRTFGPPGASTSCRICRNMSPAIHLLQTAQHYGSSPPFLLHHDFKISCTI